jgi:hypothetical protein
MYTTNQTKQFCQSNQYWTAYNTACERCDYIWSKLHRSIPVHDKWNGGLDTLHKNESWWRRQQEFRHKFPGLEHQIIIHVNIDYGEREIRYTVSFNMCDDGSWRANIYSSGTEDGWYSQIPFTGTHSIVFGYKGWLTHEYMEIAVKRELNKYLYADGLFRTLQVTQLWTKDDLKRHLRYCIANKWDTDVDYKIVEAWVRRNFNIDITHVDVNEGIRLVNRVGKQKTLMIAHAFDYSFMWDFDGDVDEIEQVFWEEMEQYEPNTILI